MLNTDIKIQNYTDLPHILVVDDDQRIRALLTRYLSAHGFVVLEAEDAAKAEALLARFEVDAMVLDVMMPGESGITFAARRRKAGADIPILLLTALGEAQDRIAGLEVGADDYLTKPFEPRELVLRLQTILRRSVKRRKSGLMQVGPWVFDPAQDELVGDDERVKLTSGEAALMRAMTMRAGEVLSRDELAEACGLDAGERTIDVQVTRLRRKIEADSKNPRTLQTVRGKGYRLRAEPLRGGE